MDDFDDDGDGYECLALTIGVRICGRCLMVGNGFTWSMWCVFWIIVGDTLDAILKQKHEFNM